MAAAIKCVRYRCHCKYCALILEVGRTGLCYLAEIALIDQSSFEECSGMVEQLCVQ
jgi:hypothetical protein